MKNIEKLLIHIFKYFQEYIIIWQEELQMKILNKLIDISKEKDEKIEDNLFLD